MFVDLAHQANRLVVHELRSSAPHAEPVTPAANAVDPYYGCGSHPEIVERIWDQLGSRLPADGRCLVYGTPALIQSTSGVILALGMGTSYVLRIREEDLPSALSAGCTQAHEWGRGSGNVTHLVDLYGADWVFGAWDRREAAWLGASYASFNAPPPAGNELLASAMPARPHGPAARMTLEIFEPPSHKPHEVATDPDAEILERTFRSLAWSAMTFVVLRKDELNCMEASGSLDPGDGLSGSYTEDGIEHVLEEPPATLELLLDLLRSYRAGDERWRTMVAWD